MSRQDMRAWRPWAAKATKQLNAKAQRQAQGTVGKAKPRRALREPSGLCRWRHHDRCTLNSVSMLNGELLQHVVQLETAIEREAGDIRNVHIYHLDQVVKELWLLRGRMATYADRNGSPVNEHLSMLFPSVMALLDDAIRVRKGYAYE